MKRKKAVAPRCYTVCTTRSLFPTITDISLIVYIESQSWAQQFNCMSIVQPSPTPCAALNYSKVEKKLQAA